MLSQEEIIKSYQAAKNKQESILPSDRDIEKIFPESFVYYQPKDIVSGDFYWFEVVNDTVLFAVADCTGHGIPGAFLTGLCYTALNRSLKEFGLLNPGHLLDKTMEILVNETWKGDKKISDGMDIALCSVTGNELMFSGAKNPLWIIRNRKLIELPATRQGIGLTDKPTPFRTEEFTLNAGDAIYLFSDGFQDQFGGEMGKKYKPASFRKLLTSISHQPMEAQKKLVASEFKVWKGDNDQVDDVTCMGVRIYYEVFN